MYITLKFQTYLCKRSLYNQDPFVWLPGDNTITSQTDDIQKRTFHCHKHTSKRYLHNNLLKSSTRARPEGRTGLNENTVDKRMQVMICCGTRAQSISHLPCSGVWLN